VDYFLRTIRLQLFTPHSGHFTPSPYSLFPVPYLESSAQDSHFWSSIDNAPEKAAMKLTNIAHILHFFQLTANNLSMENE
jgi:hypothetical protein